jgi:hypothetical protein
MQVPAYFAVIAPRQVTIEQVDSIRREKGGDEAVAILYDVSPVGLDAQALFDQLAQHPDVIVCDHHNGAAPLQEVPGREVTGAEVVVQTLKSLWNAGLLLKSDGTPLPLVGVTHSMNVDPDSIACRLLINSFSNPTLRETVWSDDNLPVIIDAARIGDTVLFGGLDSKNATYEKLSRAEKLTLTMLQLINEEKVALVIEKCLDTALLREKAFEIFQAQSATDGSGPALKTTFLRETAAPDQLKTWLSERGVRIADFLQERKYDLSVNAAEEALAFGKQTRELLTETHRDIVFSWASQSDIRSVFCGPSTSFNEEGIARMFENIERKLLRALQSPDRYEQQVRQFLGDLTELKETASRFSVTIDGKLTTTTLSGRLDRDPNKPQSAQRFPVYDWLREAAAAFGDPWLHLLDRNGQLVVSSRFAKAYEIQPQIDLSNRHIVGKLLELEATALANAQARGEAGADEQPAKFVIKPNLWLPMGKAHISRDDMVRLLLENYDHIVSPRKVDEAVRAPLYPTVTCGSEQIPFSGRFHFERARKTVAGR